MSPEAQHETDSKMCSHCKEIKPLSEFYLQGNRLQSHCKACFLKKKKRDRKMKLIAEKKKKPIQELALKNIKEVPVVIDKHHFSDLHNLLKDFILNTLLKT